MSNPKQAQLMCDCSRKRSYVLTLHLLDTQVATSSSLFPQSHVFFKIQTLEKQAG